MCHLLLWPPSLAGLQWDQALCSFSSYRSPFMFLSSPFTCLPLASAALSSWLEAKWQQVGTHLPCPQSQYLLCVASGWSGGEGLPGIVL